MNEHEQFGPPQPEDPERDATLRDRLRSADPAQHVEVSDGFAALVAARVADGARAEHSAPGEISGETSDGATPAVLLPGTTSAGEAPELGATTPTPTPVSLVARRRRRWYGPATAAAAAAVVGVLGYGIGAGGVTGSLAAGAGDAADSAEAVPESAETESAAQENANGPIRLDGPAGATASGAGAGGDAAERAAGDQAFSSSMMVGLGRATFRAGPDLSSAERSAPAFALDAQQGSTPERRAAIATAFGLSGEGDLADGQWSWRDGGRSLSLSVDGSLSLSFVDEAASPWCEGCDTSDVALPSAEDAIARLQEYLAALGEDTTTFEYTVPEAYEGQVSTTAQAQRLVDGQLTDLAYSLELSERGVAWVWGTQAAVVPLGTYPVVSESEAVARLGDPRFGGSMTTMPLDGMARTTVEDVPWAAPTEVPAPAAADSAIPWPVSDVEIVSARLGLTQQWLTDGAVVLVPAYALTDSDGGTWSVLAVADSALDLTSE